MSYDESLVYVLLSLVLHNVIFGI